MKRQPERVTAKVVKLGSNCPNTGFHNFEQSIFFFQDNFVDAEGKSEILEQTTFSPAKTGSLVKRNIETVVERSTHKDDSEV